MRLRVDWMLCRRSSMTSRSLRASSSEAASGAASESFILEMARTWATLSWRTRAMRWRSLSSESVTSDASDLSCAWYSCICRSTALRAVMSRNTAWNGGPALVRQRHQDGLHVDDGAVLAPDPHLDGAARLASRRVTCRILEARHRGTRAGRNRAPRGPRAGPAARRRWRPRPDWRRLSCRPR